MNTRTQKTVLTGLLAAVIAVMSQIQFPLPSGVPVTMQTFAIALAGYVLGSKRGLSATAIYILVGAVGVPVFAGFAGGPSVLFSPVGGYLWGFLPMSFFCGWAIEKKNKVLLILLSAIGLLACHVPGVIQLSKVAGMTISQAFLVGSLPYIVKDILSMVAAFAVARSIRRAIPD